MRTAESDGPLNTDPTPPSLNDSADVEFWEYYYHQPEIPWDLGEAAPPFIHWLNNQPAQAGKARGKMAVLGSGQGHDAALFGQHGFEVTGFDYAPSALERSQALYGQWARFLSADLFEIPTHPEFQPLAHQFDYVLEHTCFCAIRPEQRQAYIETVKFLLKEEGEYLGLFWNHGQPQGPPFDTTPEVVRQLFDVDFKFLSFEKSPHSHPRRAPNEWFAHFRVNPTAPPVSDSP